MSMSIAMMASVMGWSIIIRCPYVESSAEKPLERGYLLGVYAIGCACRSRYIFQCKQCCRRQPLKNPVAKLSLTGYIKIDDDHRAS